VACFVVFELCNLLLKSPTWRLCAPGGLPAAGLAEQRYGSGLDELADSCLLGLHHGELAGHVPESVAMMLTRQLSLP